MSHIFISYSKHDITFVRYLRTLLAEQGFSVWVDEAQIDPSVRWWKTIEQNIDACAAFIVVMSPNALESDWVEREILRAEYQKRPIYPILLAGEPWSRLANIQYEDLRAGLRAKLSPHFVRSLSEVVPRPEDSAILFTLEEGNIVTFGADVIALKYAQEFYGADLAAARALTRAGLPAKELAAQNGDFRFLQASGILGAAHALFVGTAPASEFYYSTVRELSTRILTILAEVAPETRHLAMTINGVGFGLDETETILAQFAGYMDAFRAGQFPKSLTRITVVEKSTDRLARLRNTLADNLDEADFATRADGDWGYYLTTEHASENTTKAIPATIDVAGAESRSRSHVFVVMPPDGSMDDVFYYGIQGAVHALGLLCERIEEKAMSEDLLNQIRRRIDTAAVVIAELTQPDPMLYLQVGYAWGQGRPTLLAARDPNNLLFVADQCIVYDKIKSLEAALSQALDELRLAGILEIGNV